VSKPHHYALLAPFDANRAALGPLVIVGVVLRPHLHAVTCAVMVRVDVCSRGCCVCRWHFENQQQTSARERTLFFSEPPSASRSSELSEYLRLFAATKPTARWYAARQPSMSMSR
jgi:hypothetical protein